MRNLKKVLALALVAIMVLATMATASAAFTDAAQIDNKAAAELLTQVGVITGDLNSAFNPTALVTRGQMATMLYRALNKGVDDGAYLYAGLGNACKFTDVSAANWDRNYIYYAYSVGIISGGTRDANGYAKFNPNAGVTGYAAAKMILVALGYNAEKEGLVGPDWEINALLLANSVGLFANFDKTFDISKELTKDEAALMIYNAFAAKTVIYNVLGMIEEGKTFGEVYFTINSVQGQVVANDELQLFGVVNAKDTTVLRIGSEYVQVPFDTTVDYIGLDVKVYYKGNAVTPGASSAIPAIDKKNVYGGVTLTGADKVYNIDLEGATATAANAGAVTGEANSATGITYRIKTGSAADATIKVKNVYYNYEVANASPNLATIRAGRQAKLVIIDSKNGADLAFITDTAYGTVADIGKEKNADNVEEGTITVAGTKYFASQVIGASYDTLKKDAHILYAKRGDGKIFIQVAPTITGKVTKFAPSTTVTVAGEVLEISKKAGVTVTYAQLVADDMFKTEHVFVTDGKRIVAIDDVDDGEDTTTVVGAYAGVLATEFVDGASAANVFASGTTASAKIYLDLLNGTKGIYNVNSIKFGATEVKFDSKKMVDGGAESVAFKAAMDLLASGTFVKYSTTSNGKVDIEFDTTKVIDTTASGEFEYVNGAPYVGDATDYTFVDDATTVYVYNTDKNTFAKYVGRAAIPSIAANLVLDYATMKKTYANNDTFATVFVTAADADITLPAQIPTAVDGAMILTAPVVSNAGEGFYQTFKVYEDGEVKTLTTEAGKDSYISAMKSTLVPYSKITYTLKDGIATITAVDKEWAEKGILSTATGLKDGNYIGYIANVGADFIVFGSKVLMVADDIELTRVSGGRVTTLKAIRKATSDEAMAVIITLEDNEVTAILYTDVSKANFATFKSNVDYTTLPAESYVDLVIADGKAIDKNGNATISYKGDAKVQTATIKHAGKTYVNVPAYVTNNGTTNIMIITMTDLIDSDEFSMWMGGGMTWELLMQYNSSTPLNSAAASMVTTLGIWTNNTPNAAHALNVDYKAAYSFRINAMASWAVNSYITVGATLPTMQVNTVVSDLSAYELRSQNLFHVVWTHDFDEANNRIDEAMYINGIKVAACYGAGQALGLGHKIVEAYSGQVSLGGRLTAKGGVDYPCQNSSFVDFNIYHGIATETEVADMYTAAIGALAPYEA